MRFGVLASLSILVAVGGCTYYTVAPDDAHQLAAMTRDQQDRAAVRAVRDSDGSSVMVTAGRLGLVGDWRDGMPMHLRRPTIHPAITTGIVIGVVGLAFLNSRRDHPLIAAEYAKNRMECGVHFDGVGLSRLSPASRRRANVLEKRTTREGGGQPEKRLAQHPMIRRPCRRTAEHRQRRSRTGLALAPQSR